MDVLALFMLGFAPGIFWLWLIYQRGGYIPASPHLVVRTFLWGIAVAAPVVLVESILSALAGFEGELEPGNTGVAQAAYVSFVVAGLTEELAKYLVVRKTVYDSPYFRQPLDSIIFSAAAALGFASIENVGYMFSFGAEVILVRGPFSTLAHVLFSVVWGYALGVRKQGRTGRHSVLIALVAAMAFHGLFDFLLFIPEYALWALVLFIAMGILFFPLLKVARHQSSFRNKVVSLLLTCLGCMQRSGYGASFCTTCGKALTLEKSKAAFQCGKCGCPVMRRHDFCTACGSRLNRKLVSVLT